MPYVSEEKKLIKRNQTMRKKVLDTIREWNGPVCPLAAVRSWSFRGEHGVPRVPIAEQDALLEEMVADGEIVAEMMDGQTNGRQPCRELGYRLPVVSSSNGQAKSKKKK